MTSGRSLRTKMSALSSSRPAFARLTTFAWQTACSPGGTLTSRSHQIRLPTVHGQQIWGFEAHPLQNDQGDRVSALGTYVETCGSSCCSTILGPKLLASCPERRDYFTGKHLRHRGVDEPRGSGSRGEGRGPRVKRTYEFTVGEVHIRERLQGYTELVCVNK